MASNMSQGYKRYTANGGELEFKPWLKLAKRLEKARAARSAVKATPAKPVTSKTANTALVQSIAAEYGISVAELNAELDRLAELAAAEKAVQTPSEFERVAKRVDIMSSNVVACDKADFAKVASITNGSLRSSYTSQRGERVTLRVENTNGLVKKLSKSGFAVKGIQRLAA